MILVIGGAYQGKMDYVKSHYFGEYEIVPDYHLQIEKQLQEGKDPIEEAKIFVGDFSSEISRKEELIIICNEVGSGAVPMDAFHRQYREMVGRVCCYFAKESTEVVRVVAGIGSKLKTV